jgi:hypothetical protein
MQNMQKEIDKIITDKNEEISRLKNHSQNLITQIKKLKGEKKSQQETLKQLTNKKSLIDKETMIDPIEIKKSSAVKIQVAEKGTNTSPVEVETTSDVGVQTMEAPSVLTNQNSSINKATSVHEENHIPKLNQENATSMIRENHVIRTPYRHPNHKSRYLNQSEYQCHLGRKQLTYLPKNIDTNTIKSHDNNSSWKCNVPQRIELGWSDPFTIRQFCSTLKGSYRLVSSTMTAPRTENDAKTLQAREKDVKPFHNYALRTKHFLRGRQCNNININTI